jgi:hypothetical protein
MCGIIILVPVLASKVPYAIISMTMFTILMYPSRRLDFDVPNPGGWKEYAYQ